MSKKLLRFYPSFVGEALKQKVIQPNQLDDEKTLKNIFSDNDVTKIFYLNNVRKMGNLEDQKVLQAMDLTWITEYAPGFEEMETRSRCGSFLEALQPSGDENVASVVKKSLGLLTLGFDVVEIGNHAIGVIFKPMLPVESSAERKRYNAISMEHLLSLQGIVDNSVVNEPTYYQYINLIK